MNTDSLVLDGPTVCHDLVRGWSVRSTGGGSPPREIYSVLETAFLAGRPVRVIPLDGVGDHDLVATLYGVGATGKALSDPGKAVAAALKGIRTRYGDGVSAFFPAEANSAWALRASSVADVPLADGDATGGRAVPFIQADNFFLEGVSTAPVFVASSEGDVEVYDEPVDPLTLERLIRARAVASADGKVVVADHVCVGSRARSLLSGGTIGDAVALGRSLRDGDRSLVEVLREHDADVLAEGVVDEVKLESSSGFLTGFYKVRSRDGYWSVGVVNENVAAWEGPVSGPPAVVAPDPIGLIAVRSRSGLHNAALVPGTPVVLATWRPEARWRSDRARELFGLGTVAKALSLDDASLSARPAGA